MKISTGNFGRRKRIAGREGMKEECCSALFEVERTINVKIAAFKYVKRIPLEWWACIQRADIVYRLTGTWFTPGEIDLDYGAELVKSWCCLLRKDIFYSELALSIWRWLWPGRWSCLRWPCLQRDDLVFEKLILYTGEWSVSQGNGLVFREMALSTGKGPCLREADIVYRKITLFHGKMALSSERWLCLQEDDLVYRKLILSTWSWSCLQLNLVNRKMTLSTGNWFFCMKMTLSTKRWPYLHGNGLSALRLSWCWRGCFWVLSLSNVRWTGPRRRWWMDGGW